MRLRAGDTITFAGLGGLPRWRDGVWRRVWAWLRGRDLEDRSLKQFVVTWIHDPGGFSYWPNEEGADDAEVPESQGR